MSYVHQPLVSCYRLAGAEWYREDLAVSVFIWAGSIAGDTSSWLDSQW